MAFFDELGKKITQTGQGAAKGAKNVAETMKVNGMISDEEKRINNAYLQIGKTYYENCGDNPDQLFAQLINDINDSKAKIAAYTEQLRQIKGVARCQKCGGEVPIDAPFCSSCGSPMKTAPTEAPLDSGGLVCGNCGFVVPEGKAFCSNCGGKME